MVGGSGGWQISQNNAYEELGVDCVVEGRSESVETLALFDQALRGESCRRRSTSTIRRAAMRSSSPTSARRSAWLR